MNKIFLYEEEKHIIDAAIRLGDWLLAFPELTEKQSWIIKEIQKKLRTLPDIESEIDCSYGYVIEQGDGVNGLNRSWHVCLSNYRDKSKQGALEIFNHYNPIPEPIEHDDFIDMVGNESHMHWHVGQQLNEFKPHSGLDWINEINDPLKHFKEGDRLLIEIDYQDRTFEIPCQVSANDSIALK